MMRENWKKWAEKFDALSLRERGMVFAACALALVFLFYLMLIEPLFSKRAMLDSSIAQNQATVMAVDKEIVLTIAAHGLDPDQAARDRLNALLAETAQLKDRLRHMQNGLVAPERMVVLLENLLRQHARLRLVSLKTLAPGVVGALPAPAPAATVAPAAGAQAIGQPAAGLQLHRHGVEVVVEGSYVDMVNYMQALQTMPTQVFWGKARLETEAYPVSRLTLTLYTLGLDNTWMAL